MLKIMLSLESPWKHREFSLLHEMHSLKKKKQFEEKALTFSYKWKSWAEWKTLVENVTFSLCYKSFTRKIPKRMYAYMSRQACPQSFSRKTFLKLQSNSGVSWLLQLSILTISHAHYSCRNFKLEICKDE